MQWPLGVVLLLSLAVAVAMTSARFSRVMVYNDTGTTLTELTITACGQSQTFREVNDRESVRLKLAGTGGESDVTVSTNGVLMWRGEFIEPLGGCRVTVRLRADGQVETATSISWWQKLGSQPSATAN